MGIRFLCPSGHKLNVKSFLAGKRGICPHCGAKFEIPYESVATAPPPPKNVPQAAIGGSPQGGGPGGARSARTLAQTSARVVSPLPITATHPTAAANHADVNASPASPAAATGGSGIGTTASAAPATAN